ncbi:MAG: hypothetical protein A2015_02890 [Spirochaetes bacterium GWF1_31_7]|nr:MAG: hypothetical protein A2Y30_12270 [Spirochaetes bacterium GWE1_32_154]OHD46124.1 MAG: hypothetical protein A2Y29_06980 [Spirochaetes bacterium GWE2_31_10]OHD47523.1 MAG: hypothetical protein A2015_02890 [Spirochaetes bacterium GWF1_31_7]OHD83222.1 MAG: hypothetical protein A2355_12690 [Spirochaetes bacterium RIFOXYB1_FULL_32_8]
MKNKVKHSILLTGVTGLVGSHILFELLRKATLNGEIFKIYLLTRGKGNKTGKERIEKLLQNPYTPDFIKNICQKNIESFIEYIYADINDADLTDKIQSKVSSTERLYVIHSAGSVNLFNTSDAEKDVLHNNYNGTHNLIRSLKNYDYKFIFISTAFSSGKVDGALTSDYRKFYDNSCDAFRNPYEHYKNKLENEIINLCGSQNRPYQILRPSVVCGRMLETPLYYTTKFDVIYGWTKFFWSLKQRGVNETVRVRVGSETRLNIVAVDYIAKVVSEVYNDDSVEFLNIVSERSDSNRCFYKTMLNAMGIDNFIFVDDIPADQTMVERTYYKLYDKVYGPYNNSISNEYDTAHLKSVIPDSMRTPPDYGQLAVFAMNHNFEEASL